MRGRNSELGIDAATDQERLDAYAAFCAAAAPGLLSSSVVGAELPASAGHPRERRGMAGRDL